MDDDLKIKLARLIEAANAGELTQTYADAKRNELESNTKRKGTDSSAIELKRETLHNHLEVIDLHGYRVPEARAIVGQKAHLVAQSESMMCVGFIHGMGWHSLYKEEDYDDDYDTYFPPPPLMKMVRDVLRRLANKFNCKCIEGDRIGFISGAFGHSNEGVTYFMNKKYYNFL